MVEQVRAAARDDVFEVHADCREAVELFLLCETQWIYAGMAGVPVGLNYAGVQAAARMAGVRMTRELFADLQVMEAAAAAELRRRLPKRGAGRGR